LKSFKHIVDQHFKLDHHHIECIGESYEELRAIFYKLQNEKEDDIKNRVLKTVLDSELIKGEKGIEIVANYFEEFSD
jgi:hypothetical protein